jgi:O-methyltransferase
MLRSICGVLKLFGFTHLYGRIKVILPSSFRRWISAKAKEYNFEQLATVDTLLPTFKKACKLITARVGADGFGDCLEFGVYRGASLSCMFQALNEMHLHHPRLFGFDSFAGYPAVAAIDNENILQPGDHACPIEETSKYLTSKGIDWNRTFLIKGWFADTLNAEVREFHNIEKVSIVMVDCSLYTAAKACLNFCLPLIRDVTIIFISEWNKERRTGERRAFEEFLFENQGIKAKLIDTYHHNRMSAGRFYLITKAKPDRSLSEKSSGEHHIGH